MLPPFTPSFAWRGIVPNGRCRNSPEVEADGLKRRRTVNSFPEAYAVGGPPRRLPPATALKRGSHPFNCRHVPLPPDRYVRLVGSDPPEECADWLGLVSTQRQRKRGKKSSELSIIALGREPERRRRVSSRREGPQLAVPPERFPGHSAAERKEDFTVLSGIYLLIPDKTLLSDSIKRGRKPPLLNMSNPPRTPQERLPYLHIRRISTANSSCVLWRPPPHSIIRQFAVNCRFSVTSERVFNIIQTSPQFDCRQVPNVKRNAAE